MPPPSRCFKENVLKVSLFLPDAPWTHAERDLPRDSFSFLFKFLKCYIVNSVQKMTTKKHDVMDLTVYGLLF